MSSALLVFMNEPVTVTPSGGGLLLAFPDRVLGVFLAFQTQRIPTDATGVAALGAQPLSRSVSPGGGPGTGQQPATASVYLERALINPTGPDQGYEAVTIGNLAIEKVSLHGWRLIDRNGNATTLDAQIAAGASSRNRYWTSEVSQLEQAAEGGHCGDRLNRYRTNLGLFGHRPLLARRALRRRSINTRAAYGVQRRPWAKTVISELRAPSDGRCQRNDRSR